MESIVALQPLQMAVASLQEGNVCDALLFAQKAITDANRLGVPEGIRKALNVAAAVHVTGGNSLDAIDYALRSAAIARSLSRDDLMLNSLANVMMGLVQLGLPESAISICRNALNLYGERDDCADDVRLVALNGANAALAARDHDLVIELSQKALSLYCDVTDNESACARVSHELNWMKAAAALNDQSSVNERQVNVRQITAQYPSFRNRLNLRFANALHLYVSKQKPLAAIRELQQIMPDSARYGPIHLDVLRCAAEICFATDQDQSALTHTKELLDYGAQRRAAQLASAHQSVFSLESMGVDACVSQGHSRAAPYRVGKLASMLSKYLGEPASVSDELERAARISRIGSSLPITALATFDPEVMRFFHELRCAVSSASLLRTQGETNSAKNLAADIAAANSARLSKRPHRESVAVQIHSIASTYEQLVFQQKLSHPEAMQSLRTNSAIDKDIARIFARMIESERARRDRAFDSYLTIEKPYRESIANNSVTRDLIPSIPQIA